MIDKHVAPLVFLLNGTLVSLEINPEMTALDLLHDTLKMSGTKEGCKEGDCGACTIAVGTLDEHDSISFKAINSCILPALRLHGTHVITIEGLKSQGTLHIIQQHIVNEHGIQCGFCSPGIILSFFALFASNPHPTMEEIEIALSGNICRCTGYEGIREAGKAVTYHLEGLDNKKVASLIIPEYVGATIDTLRHIPSHKGLSSYQIPKSLKEYEAIASSIDSFSVQCGATDLQVRRNLTVSHDSETIVDISQIAELHDMKVKENRLIIGSSLTITTIMEHELMLRYFPEIRQCALVMASTQIRNVASVAGNIANASPIGDASIFFLALNADITLYRAQTGTKETLPLSTFFISYKKTKLNLKDLICSLSIPIIEKIEGGHTDYLFSQNVKTKTSRYCNSQLGISHGSL